MRFRTPLLPRRSTTHRHDALQLRTLRVRDHRLGGDHLLLMTTQTDTEQWQTDALPAPRVTRARLSITVHYVAGPLTDYQGKVVTQQGARFDPPCGVNLVAGAVFIDPPALQGLHIGTYVLHEIVAWALQVAPGAPVMPIQLNRGQAIDAANRARRNKLYENFGIRFDWSSYDGIEHAGGVSVASLRVDELRPYVNWPNITSHDGFAGILAPLRDAGQAVPHLRAALKRERRLVAYHRRGHCRQVVVQQIARGIHGLGLLAVAWVSFYLGNGPARLHPIAARVAETLGLVILLAAMYRGTVARLRD